ncbi:hypothetical protein [Paludisphaera rhizosphaerae]|uniref:hypothetical protein n=1 Tax=Paludisphaera rhizosphaerae TaxID=2711216 RepID=UPI0013ED243B|nr:hypothetical protein [Paludisphaera rhizosphaerae]
MRLGLRLGVALAAVALAAAGSGTARAGFSLTLDQPNGTTVLGSSSYQYEFTGTFTLDEGYSLAGFGLYNPYAGPKVGLIGTVASLPLNPTGGTYAGVLFSVTINPTTLAGLYDKNSSGTAAPTFQIMESNFTTGDSKVIYVNYSLLVSASGSGPGALDAVPEPSAWVSASMAVVAAAGLRGRRLLRN